MEKICSKCGVSKDLSEFYKHSGNIDGLRGQCKICRLAVEHKYHMQPLIVAKKSNYNRQRLISLRLEVLTHYSGGLPRCECCNVTEYSFLTIDHINGINGPEHRRKGIVSKALYKFLKDNEFPPGFRVLCMNCNASMGWHGFCPHGGIEPIPKIVKDEKARERRKALKVEVFSHYCNGFIKCDFCKEPRIEFMSIDHINGGGCKLRKAGQPGGTKLYRLLQKNNYPADYRVLCMNCNFSKGIHKRELKSGTAIYQYDNNIIY